MSKYNSVSDFIETVKAKNPHETEFHQAVHEIAEHIVPFVNDNSKYQSYGILDRIVEPDRIIQFKVTWTDDQGNVQVNKAYRVQFNNAIGPYKGGLRFHPSVNKSILKFLGFEQIFKNSLTGLPLGGGKGGSDFNPKGKSDGEVMRFCQAFMSELYKYIGPNTDVPAGDIGVGAREIGYLFGQYKKLTVQYSGVLTGKSLSFGGSLIRPEATGYGCVYFLDEMLKRKGDGLEGKNVAISGSGNVAQYAAEKVIELGGKVISLSDSKGSIYDSEGIDTDKLEWVKELKNNRRGRIKEYASEFNVEYLEGKRPWGLECDIALPCATQNELEESDARALVENGCIAVAEGANMPTTMKAIEVFKQAGILYAPGKASNAGGVATSGLEMSQNAMHSYWKAEEVDAKLKSIMKNIHTQCVDYGSSAKSVDYVKGANIAGFTKVADAMIAQGI